MGSVGISFGSPTSGQGFDVSSTVSQIVANLQTVETPWNNQLTSLESQDTALTGIGTDLSTLSSALETLTDYQGVLSEKEGSSSDTSVLELTSADTSAIAGSHTVTVDALAVTSSYYSGDISADDVLSGSLSIQVGSGAAQTITLSDGTATDSNGDTIAQNDTLSTLASYINDGDYGVTAQVTTDSGGERLDLISNTSGSAGTITIDSSDLTDSTADSSVTFTGTAGSDASFSVDGIPMISSSNTVSDAIPGVTFQLLSEAPGTDVQVEITNDTSDVESAITTFVSAYNTVVGDLNAQEGDDSSGNAEPLYGNPVVATLQEQLESALNFLQPANAVSSSTSISSGDTFSGSLSIQVGSGSAQTVNITAGSSLQSVADAINSANLGVTAEVTTSSGASTLTLANSTSGTAGTIGVTSSLIDSTTDAKIAFGASQSNSITSLTQLGIEASSSDDGTLTLNASTLESALDSNYSAVMSFLQPSSSFTSFGTNFTNILDNLGNSSPDGVVYLALDANSSTESQLNTNISNENVLIDNQETQLTTELNEANYVLQEIPTELQQVNEMYSAITGYDQNTSS